MPSTVKSTQEIARTAVPNTPLRPDEALGKVRVFSFEHNTTTTALANGDTLNLCTIPKGYRLLSGLVVFGAMGASATAVIGIAGTTTKYLGSTDVSAAGTATFLNTVALNYGEVLTADTLIILTTGGANYASAKAVNGHILAVLD